MSGLGIVTGLAAEARILARVLRRSSKPISIAQAAGDPSGAARSLVADGAESLMSFGIAGGLDPTLRPGRVIVASQIIDSHGELYACQAAWRDGLMETLEGFSPLTAPLLGSDRALATIADKAGADKAGADKAGHAAAAVDMESHAVARVAARADLPFAAVRIIADPAERALPSCALAGFNDRGETQYAAVLWELALHPLQLPALLRVALDSARAFSVLGPVATKLFVATRLFGGR